MLVRIVVVAGMLGACLWGGWIMASPGAAISNPSTIVDPVSGVAANVTDAGRVVVAP